MCCVSMHRWFRDMCGHDMFHDMVVGDTGFGHFGVKRICFTMCLGILPVVPIPGMFHDVFVSDVSAVCPDKDGNRAPKMKHY